MSLFIYRTTMMRIDMKTDIIKYFMVEIMIDRICYDYIEGNHIFFCRYCLSNIQIITLCKSSCYLFHKIFV